MQTLVCFIYFRQVSHECYTENYCLVLFQPSTLTSAWLWGLSSPIMLCALVWYLLLAAEHYAVASLGHSVSVLSVLVELVQNDSLGLGGSMKWRGQHVSSTLFRHFDENSCRSAVAMKQTEKQPMCLYKLKFVERVQICVLMENKSHITVKNLRW